MELKLPPPLKYVVTLPCEKYVVNYTAQLIQFTVIKNVSLR